LHEQEQEQEQVQGITTLPASFMVVEMAIMSTTMTTFHIFVANNG
jgi:hypothetical protein